MHPAAHAIADQQERLTRLWHEREPHATGDGLVRLVAENHLRNFLLWHEEDQARRDDLGADFVRDAKRTIDRLNQERTTLIAQLDTTFVAALQPPAADAGCPCNSESPGMIVDRLSILALKEYHGAEATHRPDLTATQRESWIGKLALVRQQRRELTACLSDLVDEVLARRRTFSAHPVLKLYLPPPPTPHGVDLTHGAPPPLAPPAAPDPSA